MIKKVDENSLQDLTDLALKLWPDNDFDELKEEFQAALGHEEEVAFLYFVEDTAIGFIQLSIRHDYVEGSESSPVGYIEGIYVEEAYRKQKIAQRLVNQGEAWVKAHECKEMGSDCELENLLSIDFHKGISYEEANRVVCFIKKL